MLRTASADDRGSVLLLFPAATLIVLLLGSLAVDGALVHLRQRELVQAADAAAADGATIGLDFDAYRARGTFALDPDRARRAVITSLLARGLMDDLAAPPRVVVRGDVVEVHLVREVDRVLAPVVPGGHGAVRVAVTARARAPRS